jgi:hypothetical protein
MTTKRILTLLAATVALATGSAGAAGAKVSPKEAKVDVYIGILNEESNHLFENFDNYSGHVKDLKKGPTCEETGSQQWVSSMGNAPERIAAYRKGLSKGPKLDGDTPARDMVDALDALYKPNEEASTYYFERKFKNDGCKRGKELHPQLMAAWTKYMQADHTLRSFIDQYTDERDAAELTQVQKKYGKALHYYHRKLMIDGKALIRLTDRRQPDPAQVRPALATFETTLAEATGVVAKEKKGKNADALYQGGYEQLVSKAGWLKDTVTEVLRVMDEEAKNPKLATQTNARSVAMKNLVTSYNDLVEQSNQTMYSKTMK